MEPETEVESEATAQTSKGGSNAGNVKYWMKNVMNTFFIINYH